MLNLRKIYYKILDLILIYKALDVVSISRTLFLILIIIFVMLFDALSIMSVMPLVQFIQADQNIEQFIDSTNYGQYLVNFYSFFTIPLTLLNLSIVLVIFVIMRQFMNIFEVLETERTRLLIAKDLSINCFKSIMFSKAEYIRSLKQGQFTALCESECTRTSLLFKTFLQFISAGLQISAYATVMFFVAPFMTSAALLIIVLLIFSLISFVKKTHKAGELVVTLRKKFYNFVSENFSLWRLFKFGSLVNNEINKIKYLAENYADTQLKIIKYSNISRFILAVVAMCLCVIFLNLSVNYFSFDFAKITLFSIIFIRLIPLGTRLNGLINSLVAYAPSLYVINKILNDSIENKEELIKGIRFKGNNTSIEFKDVCFSYSKNKNNKILRNINLVIPSNKVTAIVGKSGAGKSTLIDLLPRIISPDSGEIYIGGKNINTYSLESIRNKISFVSQDTILFDGSIKANISYYSPESKKDDIIKASKLSGAHEFINKLPNKYEYNIGEKGQKLSGGQKQRLILARAFLSKSKILILDEATSSLDHVSEKHVKKAINEFIHMNNSTIIIIAHRHTTIENADLIVYLENGQVKDTGSPKTILSKYLKA